MKSLPLRINLFAITFLLPFTTFCQWQQISYRYYTNLNDVEMLDYSNIFIGGSDIFGAGGMILRSTDTGELWSQTLVPSIILDIDFISDSIGYAVGEYGLIMKTTDMGNNWEQQYSPSNYDLKSVNFPDEKNGFISGCCKPGPNIVLKTTDGGEFWEIISHDSAGGEGCWFLDSTHGFVGRNFLYQTSDGGTSWSNNLPGFTNPLYIYQVQFLTPGIGFVVGHGFETNDNGIVYRTTDGGYTWQSWAIDTVNSFLSVSFADMHTGYITTGPGKKGPPPWLDRMSSIFKTSDNGVTWHSQRDDIPTPYLHSINCIDADHCFAVGDYGIILKTSNGGGSMYYQPDCDQTNSSQFIVYPQPGSSESWIVHSPDCELQNAVYDINLFDITGKYIRSFSNVVFPLHIENILNGAGLLLFEVNINGERVHSGKILFQP